MRTDSMGIKTLFNHLLSSGTDLAKQGKGVIEKGLNVPDSGSERDAMMSGLGKGALAGGALSLLLGTKSGRELSGSALKYGGIAALGTVAFKAYGDWKKGQTETADTEASLENNSDIQQLNNKGGLSEKGELLTLKAMIAAAKADGHVDEDEKGKIQKAINALGASQEVNEFFKQELAKPLDPEDISQHVTNPEEAAEVYLASLLVTDEKNFMERTYLNELARLLKLEPGLVDHLEALVQPA